MGVGTGAPKIQSLGCVDIVPTLQRLHVRRLRFLITTSHDVTWRSLRF